MTDLLRPQKGARPWLPAASVTEVEILNEYDIPLIGLVEQDGGTFLYACLLGELDDLNIWAYAGLTRAECERLRSLRNEELSDGVEQALSNRMLVVALASDCELIDWEHVDAGLEGQIAVARRFLQKLRRRLDTMQQHVAELEDQREFAGC